MENREMYEESEEINLVSLLFTVLHKYRQLFVAAVICAVLGGALGVYKYSNADKQSIEQNYQEALTEYRNEKLQKETEVSSYKTQLQQNETEQERSQDDIEHTQEYISKSVLNTLDPYEVSVSTAIYYISTGYKIQPGMSYQDPDYTNAVLSAYSSMLNDHSAVSAIAQQFGMEERYLSELVNVSVDNNTDLLTINVYAQTDSDSRAILDAVTQHLEALHDTIAETVAPHTVKNVSVSTSTTVQTWLRDTQRASNDNITSLQKRLSDLQSSHSQLEENLATAQQALDELQEPAKPGAGIAKYAVIGFVVGIILVAGVATVQFLAAGKVYSARELHQTTGLAVLGVLTSDRSKKVKGLDKQINKWEHRPDGSTDAEIVDLIAATIHNRAPEAEHILVTGDIPAQQLAALSEALQAANALQGKTVAAAENILKSAATVPQVVHADAVILAADCTGTRYVDVNEQNEKIRGLGKSILGCVVYE